MAARKLGVGSFALDSLIRKKVYRLNSDHRKTYSMLLEVLTNHKQLWNDARSSAELDKFRQAGQNSAPTTPPRRSTKRDRSESVPELSGKAKKNKAQRERAKKTLQQAREHLSNAKRDPPKKDARVPSAEWAKLSSFKYSGKKRCMWYNCSLGCRFGDQCKSLHTCVKCGRITRGTGTTEQVRCYHVRGLRPHAGNLSDENSSRRFFMSRRFLFMFDQS